MANQECLDILKQGAKVWNKWREEMEGAGILVQRKHAKMLIRAIKLAMGKNGDFLRDLPTRDQIDLREADLKGANLDGANLSNVDLAGSDLSKASLIGTRIVDTNLSKANLSGAGLAETDLSGTDLSGANLEHIQLAGTDFTETVLKGTNFKRAFIQEVKFSRADFDNADLSHALMQETIFAHVDLRLVKGLETVRHIGPSTIGFDTVELSCGDIPETFLRGVGFSDIQIEYAQSLINKPIQYYPCFISYSSKDHEFAKRLHADLRENGVRCWFAPEDLKIGDKFWHRIDESIRLYDKLLVILSEHSVASVWVENEVMAALEKEYKQPNNTVLFPIKLDEAVIETDLPWAANMRRMRHTGDFTKWKNHDDYQKAFNRLLRDLKANEKDISLVND